MSKFDIDEALIRKLAKLLKETELMEIEFESEGKRVRVNSGHVTASSTVHQLPTSTTAAAAAAPPAKSDGPQAGTLASPMVGTAYLKPEPGAQAFVKVGDKVTKGQTVLIIEAMKVMNPIQAVANGTVKEILIEDGQPVEFGEPMMIIQ